MKLKTVKYVMIGLLYGLVLSLIILRGFLFVPGLWEFNDESFNYDLDTHRAFGFSTWNSFISADNGRTITAFAWQSWLFLVGNSELAQRLYYIIDIMTTSLCLFTVAYRLAEDRFKNDFARYASAFAASTIGIINPFVTMRLDNANYIFNIGVSAVAFYLVHKSLNAESKTQVVEYALILSPLQALNSVLPHTILLTYVMIGLVMVLELFYLCPSKHRNVRGILGNALIFSGVTVIATFMLLLYWILPYLTGFLGQYASNPNKAVYELVLSPINPIYRNGGIINAFRELVSFWTPVYFAQTGSFNTLWMFSSFVVPLAFLSALLIRPKDRVVHLLAVIVVIGVLLASGPRGPFAIVYLWISSHHPLASTIMYDQDVFTMYIVFAYSILFSVTVGAVCEKINPNATFTELTINRRTSHHLSKMFQKCSIKILNALFLLFLIAFGSVVVAYPLVSGDLGGFLVPTELPTSYNSMNSWLGQNLGDHRVMWVPNEWTVNWLPNAKIKQYPADLLLYVPQQPIFYPFPGSFNRPTYAFIINSLINNETMSIGKILSTTNTKFLVYHGDTTYPDEILYNSLLKQSDLKLVKSFGELYAFENNNTSSYVYGVNKTILIVGGLGALLPLTEIQSFNPADYAVVFLEQQPTSVDLLRQLMNFDSKLIFYGNKNFDDLVLDTLSSKYYYSPYNFFTTSASYHWKVGSLTDWIGLAYLPNLPFRYDFDLGQGFILTSEGGATFDIPLSIQSAGQYEIWMRLMIQPAGGNVEVYLNGERGIEINTQSQLLSEAGFKWVHVTTSTLAAGKNLITIKNNNGDNIINSLAIVPKDVFVQHAKNILDLVDSSNVSLVFLPYPYSFPQSRNRTVYHDNFANLSNWVVLRGYWSYKNNTVTGLGPLATMILKKTYGPNFTVSVDAMIKGKGQASILFRLSNGTGYSFELSGLSNTTTISKFSDGYAVSNLATRSYPVESGIWYSLKVSVQGNEIQCYINNVLVFDIYDTSFKGQVIGLHSYNGITSYKNFKISIPQIAASTPWPTERNYMVAVLKEQANGSHWAYYGPVSLMANRTVTTTLEPESAKQLVVYSVINGQELKIDAFFKSEKIPAVTGYDRLDATDTVIKINASSPFILVYMESYNDLWQATTNGTFLYHFPVYSAMNAFIVNKDFARSTINVTFLPERSFKIGSTISLVSLVTILVLFLFMKWINGKNKKHGGFTPLSAVNIPTTSAYSCYKKKAFYSYMCCLR